MPSSRPSSERTPSRARFALVVFDLDGTLVEGHEPVWKRIHEGAGSDPDRRKRALMAGLSGAISYDAWFAEDVAMLRDAGATRESLRTVLSALQPTPGARELVDDLRAVGSKVAVLSGGLELVLQTVLPGL